MINDYFLSLLQQAINSALQWDADLPLKLQPLQGKLVQLMIRPFNQSIIIAFTATTIHLTTASSHPADTIIHGTPFGLMRLGLTPADQVRSLLNDQLHIEGDFELGLQVKQLFSTLDLDWEAQLAHLTGDVLAHQVGRLVRGGINRVQGIHANLKTQCSEYLHEELQLFPPVEEINDFYADIDELSLRVERLEAHLNHYRAHHATP